ncbi:hypothetical protein DRO54_07395 [Candidatus Bathyarchaeota archaeon]|nr:MAG: hypothetical protein DRO54_07395 [Candidatus Bathyarchaeota archaeon]
MEISEKIFPFEGDVSFEDLFGEFHVGGEVPEIPEFRIFVDKIPRKRDRLLVQALYLTAARVSELCRRVSPSELVHDLSKPYGLLHGWKIGEYLGEKALLLRYAVAKRVKKEKRKDLLRFFSEFQAGKLNLELANELKTALTWKYIALPCNPFYEPWTVELLKYIKQFRSLTFNLTRQRIWQIVKSCLKPLDPEIHTHSLRHYRVTHLASFYNFDGWDLCIYAGWTFKTTMGRLGMPSGQLDIYAHLPWKRYFPKLLKPLGI